MAIQTPTASRGAPLHLGKSRPRYGERIIEAILALCAFASVVTTVGIVIALIEPTIEFFGEVPITDFFTGTEWSPLFRNGEFGVLPLLSGTFVVTTVALALCIPVGLGAAIFLSEYASRRTRKILKPLLEILAGIPTVVYGFFAFTFVTPLLQDIWPFGDPPFLYNALSAGLVMGVMILPTVASLSEDAMAAVPRALREGAFGLGANRMVVSTRVVVPAALSGIVAAFVLAISRAVGETMIVLIAAGSRPNLSLDPRDLMQTMTAFIGQTGLGDVATGSTAYKTLFAVASCLFVITFVMNIISIRLVRRFREVYE